MNVSLFVWGHMTTEGAHPYGMTTAGIGLDLPVYT